MNKNISIIKKSSLVIMVLSLLGAAMYVIAGISMSKATSSTFRNYLFGVRIGDFIYALVLVISALIFFRISRSGRPFTRGNVWAVRGIAGLFVVKVLVQAILEGKELGFFKAIVIRGVDSIFFVALFLVIAEIMRYGKLLQNESDETL